MIGHTFAFTQTNQDHWIPLCSCGWAGATSSWRTIRYSRPKREVRNFDLTVDAIRREWEDHVVREQDSIEKASARVLAANAEAVDRLIPTMLRPGRFCND